MRGGMRADWFLMALEFISQNLLLVTCHLMILIARVIAAGASAAVTLS
jgi:hypothetical protein